MRAAIAAAMLLLLPAGAGAAEERNPFDQAGTLNYEEAIKTCEIKGIVIAEGFRKVVLCCGEKGGEKRYGVKDRVTVRLGSADHLFTIVEIQRRAVLFRDREGKTHEVELQ